ncbi:MAG: GGDEF domain-containing protein [Usitatibacteraceae bacterium]
MKQVEADELADADLEVLVNIDKLQLLYRQSLHSVFASVVAASLWAAVMWLYAPRTALLGWIAAMALVSALRGTLLFAYRRSHPLGTKVLAWKLPYTISLFLSAVVWSSTAFVAPSEPLLFLCVTYVFLIGLAGAALPAYGVFMHMAVVTICTLLLPMLGILLLRGESLTVLMAASGVWFFLTSLRALSVHNATVTQSFRLGHELRAANRTAALLADTDVLTGLKNRRAFGNVAGALLDLAAREHRPATMMLIDIDDFKQINDRNGHSAGDAALLRLSEVLVQKLRVSDLCARIGGDEFAVLLHNTTEATAREVAEKLQAELDQLADEMPMIGAISLSIGLAEGISPLQPLLHRADAAMYEAKRKGKRRIEAAE